MRAHQEPSDADTLVYVDIAKIASELDCVEEIEVEVEVEADDTEALGEMDGADSLRGSQASLPPQAEAKGRSRYPLAVFALLIGLAFLALRAERGRLGAPLLQ